MIVLILNVNGQEMTLVDQNSPVEKTQGLIKCIFDFQTDDWDETIKTAYFKNATTGTITSQVLSDNRCLIPPEALSDTGYVSFSVAGEKESYRITSSVVQFFNRATVYGGNSSDPTPSQYEQIMAAAAAAKAAAESAEKTADDIKEKADSGDFNGEQGPKGDTGPQGPQGPQGEQGPQGDSYFKTVEGGLESSPAIITEPGIYIVTSPGMVKIEITTSSEISEFNLQYQDEIAVLANSILMCGTLGTSDSGFITLLTGNFRVWQKVGSVVKEFSLFDFLYYIAADNNRLFTMSDVYSELVAESEIVGNKKDKPVISAQDTSNIALNNNTEYRLQVAETLNITLPISITDDYECSLVFESGDTATVLSYTADTIKFVGDDCDAEGDFIPQANKGYEVSIKNLGYNRIVARVGAF